VYHYIETTDQFKTALIQLSDLIKQNFRIGVDTEFYRVNTYWPILSLVQIAAEDQVFLFDALSLEDSILDLSKILCDARILKIFHSAEQDLGILNKLFQNEVTPVFDTQIAAKLLGFGQQIGYGNLVELALQASLSKQEQFSKWLLRPLRKEQLFYASLDVIYLAPLYEKMQNIDPVKLKEAHKPLQKLVLNAINPAALLKKIKRKPTGKKELYLLEQLVVLREEIAQQDDIPRQKIMSDRLMLDLVQRAFNVRFDLQKIPGFRPHVKKKWGDTIYDLLSQERYNHIQSLENCSVASLE
jgi:ribonuclease D